MNEFCEADSIDEFHNDSLLFSHIETQEEDELQEFHSVDTQFESPLSEKSREISELEHQYEQAKLSIDMARTKSEQEYWMKRADELWEEKDNA